MKPSNPLTRTSVAPRLSDWAKIVLAIFQGSDMLSTRTCTGRGLPLALALARCGRWGGNSASSAPTTIRAGAYP
jgi:hypothetical protein